MYKVAICDDNKKICEDIKNIINEYSRNNDEEIVIVTFNSGIELLNYIKKYISFDLIFIDINMDDLNGIRIGEIIRDEFKNESVKLVYISSLESYAMELFKLRPMDFLIKPIKRNIIENTISKAIKISSKGSNRFSFKQNGVYKIMETDNILYFSGAGRKVKIISSNDIEEFYGNMDNIEDILRNKGFIRIHKSFFINEKYIVQYEYNRVTLMNGDVINISQPFRKNTRKKIMTEIMN